MIESNNKLYQYILHISHPTTGKPMIAFVESGDSFEVETFGNPLEDSAKALIDFLKTIKYTPEKEQEQLRPGESYEF